MTRTPTKMEAPETRISPGEFELTDVHRRWAIDTLELDPGAPAEELRTRALQQIESDEFVLWGLHDLSVRILAGGPNTDFTEDDRFILDEVEMQDCTCRLNEFASAYFGLEAEERRRQHASLSAECRRFPVLRKRLELLAPGLSVTPDLAAETDDDVRRLGEAVIQQFLAWPNGAARMRRSFQRATGWERPRWRRVVRQLVNRYPWAGELGSTLLTGIRESTATSPRARRRVIRSLAQKVTRRALQRESGEGSATGRYILLFIGAMIVSRIFMLGQDSDPEPRYSFPAPVQFEPYRYSAPEYQLPEYQMPTFDPELFNEYQRLLDEQQRLRDKGRSENGQESFSDAVQRAIEEQRRGDGQESAHDMAERLIEEHRRRVREGRPSETLPPDPHPQIPNVGPQVPSPQAPSVSPRVPSVRPPQPTAPTPGF